MAEILELDKLRGMIPCKEALLLLDRVLIESETKASGMRVLSMNELCFTGHFPGHPILPGVLQVEAVVQLAEVLLRKKLDPGLDGDFYLKELRRVKFRRPCNPGDRLLIQVEATEFGSDCVKITGSVTNNGGVSCNMQGVVAVRPKIRNRPFDFAFNEFDKSDKNEMDVGRVMELIPHRYPFLFVDYVAKSEGSHVTGVKNAVADEPLFRTYDDGYSVMTSSVHPEIAAQAGAIYMLSREANRGKIAYFMGIDESQFMHPIFPGDQLRLEIDMPDTKSRFGRGEGCIIVNERVVTHSVMFFAIVDP